MKNLKINLYSKLAAYESHYRQQMRNETAQLTFFQQNALATPKAFADAIHVFRKLLQEGQAGWTQAINVYCQQYCPADQLDDRQKERLVIDQLHRICTHVDSLSDDPRATLAAMLQTFLESNQAVFPDVRSRDLVLLDLIDFLKTYCHPKDATAQFVARR